MKKARKIGTVIWGSMLALVVSAQGDEASKKLEELGKKARLQAVKFDVRVFLDGGSEVETEFVVSHRDGRVRRDQEEVETACLISREVIEMWDTVGPHANDVKTWAKRDDFEDEEKWEEKWRSIYDSLLGDSQFVTDAFFGFEEVLEHCEVALADEKAEDGVIAFDLKMLKRRGEPVAKGLPPGYEKGDKVRLWVDAETGLVTKVEGRYWATPTRWLVSNVRVVEDGDLGVPVD